MVGCTSPLALNYNPLATLEAVAGAPGNGDKLCVFAAPGCVFSSASNFDPAATVNDGSCAFPVRGCTDPTAANFYAAATADDAAHP